MNALARFGGLFIRHPQSVLFVAIMLIGVIMGFVFQEALFLVMMIGLEGLVILIPVILILCVIALIFLLMRRPIGNLLRYLFLICFASALSLICFLGTGSLINRSKIDAVDHYVTHAAAILDQIKAREGAYPPTLPVRLIGEPPSLLRDYGSYTATRDTFCFEYTNEPAGWAGGEGLLKFDSTDRKWVNER